MKKQIMFLAVLLGLLVSCRPAEPAWEEPTPEQEVEGISTASAPRIDLILTSPAFNQGEVIPVVYTCDGRDISPPLDWTDPPPGTQTLALIMDDPDAPGGVWVHWVLYNIPASTRSLSESIPAEAVLGNGSLHGKNSWGRTDYGGPCPPSGTHRYFFKLYALDSILQADAGLTNQDLMDMMEEYILAETQLMGSYQR